MACTLHVAWDERLTSYDFGPDHPLAPVRVELTVALAGAFGVLAEPGVTVAAPAAASEAELELVHDPRYITAVRTGIADAGFGLGTPDNPVFPGMHEASALVEDGIRWLALDERRRAEGQWQEARERAGGLGFGLELARLGVLQASRIGGD